MISEREALRAEVERLQSELAAAKKERVAIHDALHPGRGMADNCNLPLSVKNLNDHHLEICELLRSAVKRHRLGLGGERLDRLVVDALDAATARAEAAQKELATAKERGDDSRTEMLGACFDRDRAEAHAAELRDVLESLIKWAKPLSEMAGTEWADEEDLSQECHWLNEYSKEGIAALARTPAQSLAKCKAAALQLAPVDEAEAMER